MKLQSDENTVDTLEEEDLQEEESSLDAESSEDLQPVNLDELSVSDIPSSPTGSTSSGGSSPNREKLKKILQEAKEGGATAFQVCVKLGTLPADIDITQPDGNEIFQSQTKIARRELRKIVPNTPTNRRKDGRIIHYVLYTD